MRACQSRGKARHKTGCKSWAKTIAKRAIRRDDTCVNTTFTRSIGDQIKGRGLAIGGASLLFVLVVAILLTVWPTLCRYDQINLKGNVLPVRTHRFTGRTEILYPDGWRIAESSGATESGATKLQELPLSEISQLQGTAEFDGLQLSCRIHNGSQSRIREILVHLTVTDRTTGKPVMERDYRLSTAYYTDPFETGIFRAYVGFELLKDQKWTWFIKSAKGTPP